MRQARRAAVIAFVAWAVSCSPSAKEAPAPAPTPAVRVRGELSRQGSAYHFRGCSEADTHPVDDRTNGDLPGLWRALGADSSQALFVEVRAESSADSVIVREVRRAQPIEMRGCEEDWNYEIRAHGNEPFWSVTVTRGAAVVFEQPDEPRRIEFPYAEPTTMGGKRIYRATSGADSLVLTLEGRRCQDGMSGAIFPLTAEARVRGRTLRGCAREGAPR